jgi:hypothetical protein
MACAILERLLIAGAFCINDDVRECAKDESVVVDGGDARDDIFGATVVFARKFANDESVVVDGGDANKERAGVSFIIDAIGRVVDGSEARDDRVGSTDDCGVDCNAFDNINAPPIECRGTPYAKGDVV